MPEPAGKTPPLLLLLTQVSRHRPARDEREFYELSHLTCEVEFFFFFFFFRAPIVTTLATGKTTRGLGWFFCVQLSEDFVAINLSRARWTYRKRNQVWTSTSRSYFCRSDMYVCVTGSVDRSVTLMISCEVPCGGHSTSPAQPHMTVTSNMLNLSQMCMFKMT